METNKLDKKKLIIMLIPVIISGMIYLLFFGKKENIPAKENSESFIIPNSSTEDIPASKAEIYKKEWERENKKQREKEDSQISSEYFYSLGGNTEKEKEKQQLSQKESIEKISELLPASGEPRKHQTTRLKPKKKKWENSEVDDPLAPYKNFSGEKKKEEKNTPVHEIPVIPELPEKNAMPENTPGIRTRNNTISPVTPETEGLIAAAIHDDQTIINGSTVKMRLRQDIYINSEKIPVNSFIYGIARFSNERVLIKLESIRIAQSIYPFSKSVIDQDGIEGLFFPMNLKNQIGTEMGNEGIDEIFNRATAGSGVIGDVISAGKSALKRKNSEKKVTLKANYKIFLK